MLKVDKLRHALALLDAVPEARLVVRWHDGSATCVGLGSHDYTGHPCVFRSAALCAIRADPAALESSVATLEFDGALTELDLGLYEAIDCRGRSRRLFATDLPVEKVERLVARIPSTGFNPPSSVAIRSDGELGVTTVDIIPQAEAPVLDAVSAWLATEALIGEVIEETQQPFIR